MKGGRVDVNYFRVKTNVGVMWMQMRRVSFGQVIYLFFNEWTKQMRIQTIVRPTSIASFGCPVSKFQTNLFDSKRCDTDIAISPNFIYTVINQIM